MPARHFHTGCCILVLLALLITPHSVVKSEVIHGPTPPVLITNPGLKITQGGSGVISNAALRAENGAVPAERLFYTLQSTPQHGTLTRNGAPLVSGDAFTQADIDAGLIAYQHDGGTASQDNIGFVLSQGPLIQRVSILGDGTPMTSPQADGLYHLSGDGHYFTFFTCEAVVPMSYNGKNNILMRDLETGGTLLISRGASGTLSDGDSILPFVSYDGRYVTFASNASNLLSNTSTVTNEYHIYRFDTLTQSMEKVDGFPLGNQNIILQPQGISDDGQVILYTASFLNQPYALYDFDFTTHTQSLIISYPQTNAFWSALSADGRYVATSTGLLYDRQTHTSRPIPLQYDNFALSGSGQYLAFIGADGLATGDNNGAKDVLVYDQVANTYDLISPPTLEPGPWAWVANAITPTISTEGRFVAYAAYQTINQTKNLQVIVHDRVLKTDRVVSTSTTGQPGNSYSLLPNLSAMSDRLVFYSTATNLIPDGHSEPGYYLRQLLTSTPQTFSIAIDQNKYYFLPVIQTSS